MNSKSATPIAGAIEQLQRQLDEFRSAQPHRTKLPETLWQAAVELARQHGVYSVAHPLRLDYVGLKKRLDGVPDRKKKAAKPAFVELIADHSATMADCVIEFESSVGSKMRIQWKASHYLGYEQPVGEHLKFLVSAEGRPIACLAWSSAPRHLGSRDRYIGWDAAARRSRIRFIAYNTRFLILPWVRVEHLASHLLGRMAARISDDWQQMYGNPIYFLETFIDPERFRGTCYRAANWVLMGRTTGRGKQSNSYVPNRSIKEVLGYPLTKRFRELLGGVQ